MTTTTYCDGIATILTSARKTEVHVSATASIILEHGSVMGRPSATDARALAAGFLYLERENAALRAELVAACAGMIGREHAKAMQGAREIIAAVNAAGEPFFEMYDKGDAPDHDTDVALRNALSNAVMWLIRDSGDVAARAKVLKGGA